MSVEGITREWGENELYAEYSQTVTGIERVREWSLDGGLLDDDDIFIYMRLYFKHVHCAQFSDYNIYFILSLSAVGGAVL